ncbi:MAG: hypothetical protein Q9P14_17055 [candidate division KSB1 bacterium]|nr:hypothetical protein [candidate division KSB1 bacterium]
MLIKITNFVNEVARFKTVITNQENSRSVENLEDSLSFSPEFYGTKKGKRKSKFEYESNHGLIVNALEEWLKNRMESNLKTFNTSLIDLGVSDGNRTLSIFEIKTSFDSQSIYTGIGQLMFHSAGEDRIRKYLVLPFHNYKDKFLSILKALNINLIQFKFERNTIAFID